MRGEFFKLSQALQDEIRAEYNPFEPNNQSARYKLLLNAQQTIVALSESTRDYEDAFIAYNAALHDELIPHESLKLLQQTYWQAREKQEACLNRFIAVSDARTLP